MIPLISPFGVAVCTLGSEPRGLRSARRMGAKLSAMNDKAKRCDASVDGIDDLRQTGGIRLKIGGLSIQRTWGVQL